MERFIAVFDPHYGFEKRRGRLSPLHDQRAVDALLAFSSDFKPHHIILGGDILDCGAVSHHNHGKPRAIEGMRLIKDAEIAKKELIVPLERTAARPHRGRGRRVYLIGNHEDWLSQLLDKEPGLEGLVDAPALLDVEDYEVLDQGEVAKFGHLHFIHGDTVGSVENVAKAAVTNYDVSIAFGHHHTAQVFTKTSAITTELPKQGIAVGCLCHKAPLYGKLRPNRWCQGFLSGVIMDDGYFFAHHTNIIDGRCVVGGKEYKG